MGSKKCRQKGCDKDALYKSELCWEHLPHHFEYEGMLIYQKSNLQGVNLEGVRLVETDLNKANLSQANLKKADLSRANLTEANLVLANLEGAVLWYTNLKKANLENANLSNADLEGCDLADANLRGSILDFADISGADISGADFRGASLKEVMFSHFICSKPPKLDPQQENSFKQERLPPPKITVDDTRLRIYLEYEFLPVNDFNNIVKFFNSLYNGILRYHGLKISKERKLRINWVSTSRSIEIILDFIKEVVSPGLKNPAFMIVLTFYLLNWTWKNLQDRIMRGLEIKEKKLQIKNLEREIVPKIRDELAKHFPDIKEIEIRKDTNQIILWVEKCDDLKTKIDKLPHITKLQVNEIVVKDTTEKEKKTKSQKGGRNVKK